VLGSQQQIGNEVVSAGGFALAAGRGDDIIARIESAYPKIPLAIRHGFDRYAFLALLSNCYHGTLNWLSRLILDPSTH